MAKGLLCVPPLAIFQAQGYYMAASPEGPHYKLYQDVIALLVADNRIRKVVLFELEGAAHHTRDAHVVKVRATHNESSGHSQLICHGIMSHVTKCSS